MAENKTLYTIDLRDQFSPKLKKAGANFDKFNTKASQASSGGGALGGLSSALGSGALGFAAIGAAALAGTKKLIDLGSEMESIRTSFSVMFQGKEKGDEMLSLLNEFANVTPFTNDQVIKAGKTLKAFGFEADSIAPTLKILGDTAAGSGSSLEDMARIFGKIKGNGRLMGAELDMLVDRGFNPLTLIAKKTGKDVTDLRKEMSKGLISFNMVQDAFVSLTTAGGDFDNMMVKQSLTFGGLISTIQGKLGALFAKGGEGFTNSLKPILTWTIRMIDLLPQLNIEGLTLVFKDWFGVITDIMNPLGDLFGLIFKGDDELSTFQNVVNGVAAAFRASTIPIRGFISLVKDVFNLVKGGGSLIGGIFTGDVSGIKKGIEELRSGFKNSIEFGKSEYQKFVDIFNSKALEKQNKVDLNSAMSLDNLMSIGGGASGTSSGGEKDKVSGNISGVSSGGIKNVSLSINKLVEEIVFNSTTSQDLSKLKDMVTRVLVEAASDATRLVGG